MRLVSNNVLVLAYMNKYTHSQDKYFRTPSLYVSAFLFAKGLSLVNIDKTSKTKCLFVFLDSPDRELLVQQYSFAPPKSPDCLVDARELLIALKTLKEKLYQGDF